MRRPTPRAEQVATRGAETSQGSYTAQVLSPVSTPQGEQTQPIDGLSLLGGREMAALDGLSIVLV